MRTKTLLLFVFLLTGMAFSQDGGTGYISFENITLLLTQSNYKMRATLKEWGYESKTGKEWKKGEELFQLLPEADGKGYYYAETRPSTERRAEIITQCKNAGLKVEREVGNSYILLKGSGYVVDISTNAGIKIKKLRQK